MLNRLRILLLVSIANTFATEASFDGYKVLQLSAKSLEDIKSVSVWQSESIDFWTQPKKVSDPFDVVVKPSALKAFEKFLTTKDIRSEVLIDDLQKLLQDAHVEQFMARSSQQRINPLENGENSTFAHFYSPAEIEDYLDYLSETYPAIVEVETIGTSIEGRAIRAVKISINGKVDGRRPTIFVDAGHHAREWASHMSALYLIYNLVERSQQNLDVLDKIDWIIVPIVNADGYAYTQNSAQTRLWRKNRRISKNTNCIGVDLNRNYDYKWESDARYCYDTYSGTAPFSEPESLAIGDTLNKYKNGIKLYLTFHSYGDYILYPYGYDGVKVANWKEHELVGKLIASAIYDSSKERYQIGNSALLLYPAPGGSDDYAASIGVNLSFTVEISKGSYGFVLPTNQILRVGKEIFAGSRAAALYVAQHYT